MRIPQIRWAGRSFHVYPFLLLLFAAAPAFTVPAPITIGFTGRLTAPNSAPAPNGPHSLVLSLYETDTGGVPVWSEAKTVQVTDGLFSTALGTAAALPDTLDFSRAYFVGVKAGEDPEMQPRLALQGVPYALFAQDIAAASVDASKLKVDPRSLTAVSGGILMAEIGGTRVQLDQPGASGWIPASDAWQSFTATRMMALVEITIGSRRPQLAPKESARLGIYEGEGTGGRLLGSSVADSYGGDGVVVFRLNPPVLILPGTVYTFHVTPPADFEFSIHDQNPYSGGRSSLNENTDLWFNLSNPIGNLKVLGSGEFTENLAVTNSLTLKRANYTAPLGLTTEGYALNLDYNLRYGDKDTTLPGGALRIGGMAQYNPLFQFISRVPGNFDSTLVSITEDGNVGIGTREPKNGLVVSKGSGAGTSLTTGVHLGIDVQGNAHTELVGGMPYIDFNNDTTTDNKARIILSATDTLRVEVPKLQVAGTLSKSAGSFRIDHPLDPERKYLYHSFVESPDMMNVYNGNVSLDANGRAEVTLPDWFEALNRDFRYQLTALGAPGPNLYVEREIGGNRFTIAGGQPGQRVSWQVTGIRRDAYANAHRIPVEEDKPASDTARTRR